MMETMGKPDKDINESMKHICDVVQKRIDEAYQRGVEDGRNETWEAAKKVSLYVDESGLSVEELDEIFGCATLQQVFRRYSAQQTIEKLKAYEEKQKADDEIKVGDEVNWGGDCFIVTRIFQPRNMKEQCDGIDNDGCVYHDVLMDDLEKTGRHSDIMKILEEVQT